MADVFSQIYLQIVFTVKNRQALISPTWEEHMYQYATGIVQARGHKMLAIGGVSDHIHLFIGFKPSDSLSDLVREIKTGTSHFIKNNYPTQQKFEWQAGYGAFSYSRSHREAVCKYVLNQKNHHQAKSFKSEFMKMLEDYEVELGRKTMFDFLDTGLPT
ncbi:MAG: IS200/IS605 family transposase [Saprospiraceae bacterium]|nr:IS200/IS605 family transposase [Saprospiraceae bacterium]